MRFEFRRAIGVAREIVAVGKAVAEQHVHDAAGERAVGARPQQDLDVGLLHGVVVVDIDRRDLGAALLARPGGVGHHVDLGRDRVGAPDHDQVGLRHLARIDAGDLAGAGGEAGAGDGRADGAVEARIFLDVGEPVDAVAHHEAHRAGIVIRPHRLRAEVALGRVEPRGDLVERLVPGDRARTGRSPSGRCGAADASAGRDDGCARHSARPWRRPRRPCRSAASSRAPGRSPSRR